MMFSKFFNWEDFFRFSCLVILVKYWFIVLASIDSSEIRLLSSISTNLLVFKHLLLKNGFIVFQKFLLSFISLTLIFSKCSFFVFLKRFTQNLRCFLVYAYNILFIRTVNCEWLADLQTMCSTKRHSKEKYATASWFSIAFISITIAGTEGSNENK